ncbi:glycine-rich domain-containing protein 1-like isoform X1 [Primulina eburnea]|uniref:glycine-rich domain-containing protein 1-like isoform X1 n=1 Tax=Primulina eburnea TaxID=1245227 RepID=UPI003C6CB065
MEVEQELEWKAAQSTAISVQLVPAAKRHLKFLATVDRNRWLYESPGLERAIYRYNACWLPLLAKHSESPFFEGPLVVPFDCEWIWHCHRLNPVRYKSDCEEFYGRILDNENVVSSLDVPSGSETEKVWKMLYSGEHYDLDFSSALQENAYPKKGDNKCTKYDLILAVQRQSPFCYQVSRAHMNDNRYLEGAVARYKGFLHLIKRNTERSIKSFSVPTYDIDLIWHTHQLHPASYCKDLLEIMGKVLNHDDTDSDRTKGEKLDVGFSTTTKTFEEMYGSRYWRAGAMYRGSTPSPVRTMPYPISTTKKVAAASENQKIDIPKIKDLEVMLEFVNVRNLPEEQKGTLSVSFSKTQPDAIFNAKRSLKIFSESGLKQVATFHCEPTGHLIFELMSCSPPSLPRPKSSKSLGVASVSLEDFLSPDSNLIVEKWLDLVPNPNTIESKPIGLRVGISVTVPTPLPHVLHIVNSQPFSKASCLFPLLMTVKLAKSRTRVFDAAGNLVMNLQIRSSKKLTEKKECKRRLVIGTTAAGETRTLAESVDSKWSMVNSPWFLQFPSSNNDDGHILQLSGPHIVRLFPGRRLDYESKCCEKHKCEREIERHLVTAAEFSADYPYGRAVALLDLKSGTVKVKEEWFLFPCLILALILGKEGLYHSPTLGGKAAMEKRL